MTDQTRYIIAVQNILSDRGRGWMPMRGLRYTSEGGATAKLGELRHAWDVKAETHPWLKGRFDDNYRIFPVPPGKSFEDVVNAIDGCYAATLGGSTSR